MNEPDESCAHCGAHSGTFCHDTAEECVKALKSEHAAYRSKIKNFVVDNLEEVHNHIGGVIGYRLHLSAIQTETFQKMIESE